MKHITWLGLLLGVASCNSLGLFGKGKVPPTGFNEDELYEQCGFAGQAKAVDAADSCDDYEIGTFNPWIEWEIGKGKSMMSLPAVGDIDGDGMPEVAVNMLSGLGIATKGALVVWEGDGSALHCRDDAAKLAYASGPVLADLDGDGNVEILVVRSKGDQNPLGTLPKNTYTVVAYDNQCKQLWESAVYDRSHFDYATGLVVSDMDADGSPEIIAGRVILHADGTERGVGAYGHGSYGRRPNPLGAPVAEAAVPAVVDLDLDGIKEVIVGNAMYTPDGETKWWAGKEVLLPPKLRTSDGMVAVANLDNDPQGEFIVISFGTIRAHDTDGTLLWGPKKLDPPTGPADTDEGNIAAPASVADLDGDGLPEIISAAGNRLVVYRHDGTEFWSKDVHDMTGATGASVFDFEGDGIEEVVYIDEVAMYAFDGETGDLKFYSDKHASPTMFDYPVIVDVDADGQAEILVAHAGYPYALSIYGAGDGRWAPTRRVWNQHAYDIANVNDNLSIPSGQPDGFAKYNTWHAATDRSLMEVTQRFELQAKVGSVCELECPLGRAWISVRPINRTDVPIPAGVPIALYARDKDGKLSFITSTTTKNAIPAATMAEPILMQVPTEAAEKAAELVVAINDDGQGHHPIPECKPGDNQAVIRGPFCK